MQEGIKERQLWQSAPMSDQDNKIFTAKIIMPTVVGTVFSVYMGPFQIRELLLLTNHLYHPATRFIPMMSGLSQPVQDWGKLVKLGGRSSQGGYKMNLEWDYRGYQMLSERKTLVFVYSCSKEDLAYVDRKSRSFKRLEPPCLWLLELEPGSHRMHAHITLPAQRRNTSFCSGAIGYIYVILVNFRKKK